MEKVPKQDPDNRPETLQIGPKHYRIVTSIDEASYDRVAELVQQVAASIPQGVSQEERLLLTCLKLGLTIEKTSDALRCLVPEGDEKSELDR
ncbi:MAG: hypothetical protein K9L28_05655 [Synergistales bacterium]|nr:hypothetical protein [Synergistales bacterium]